MIRRLLLLLSRSRRAARAADSLPGVRSFARRFVAGSSLEEVPPAIRRLNDAGFVATTSFLGENVETAAEADTARDEYLRLADLIAEQHLSSGISVKLTQLGLEIDRDRCRERFLEVARAAADRDLFVRIDMEHSAVVDQTLAIYRQARAAGLQRVGVVIQSYLRRSRDDIEALVREDASIRLVKGAYLEPPSVAFPAKADVDDNFRRLIDAFQRNRGECASIAVATHDERMIDYALGAFARESLPPQKYEFQMIYGIRGDLQRRLRDGGQRVRIYVPYGSSWYPYLVRRLAERPANLFFFLRNAFRG